MLFYIDILCRQIRSCSTLQKGMHVVREQHASADTAMPNDALSQVASTIESLGFA